MSKESVLWECFGLTNIEVGGKVHRVVSDGLERRVPSKNKGINVQFSFIHIVAYFALWHLTIRSS